MGKRRCIFVKFNIIYLQTNSLDIHTYVFLCIQLLTINANQSFAIITLSLGEITSRWESIQNMCLEDVTGLLQLLFVFFLVLIVMRNILIQHIFQIYKHVKIKSFLVKMI